MVNTLTDIVARILQPDSPAVGGIGLAEGCNPAEPAGLDAECPAAELKPGATILCAGSETSEAARLLQREGYRVVFVENGQRAWHRLVTAPFDLLLAPLGLRGLDGIRLAERIRRLWITTPILFLSQIGNPFTRTQQARLGIAGVLPRACPSHVLLAAVCSALRSSGHGRALFPCHASN